MVEDGFYRKLSERAAAEQAKHADDPEPLPKPGTREYARVRPDLPDCPTCENGTACYCKRAWNKDHSVPMIPCACAGFGACPDCGRREIWNGRIFFTPSGVTTGFEQGWDGPEPRSSFRDV